MPLKLIDAKRPAKRPKAARPSAAVKNKALAKPVAPGFQGKSPSLGGQGATGNAASLQAAARRRTSAASRVDPSTIKLPDATALQPYDPNTLDPEAIDSIAQADQQYNRIKGESDTTYQRRMAAIGSQRPQLDLQHTDDQRSNENAFTSRGLLRSGLRAVASGRLRSGYTDALNALDREGTYARQDYDSQLFNATQDRDFAVGGAKNAAAARAAARQAALNQPIADQPVEEPAAVVASEPAPDLALKSEGVANSGFHGDPNLFGPWDSKPNLDPAKFDVHKNGGKWYAYRKAEPLRRYGDPV